jgi:hypothetical protein
MASFADGTSIDAGLVDELEPLCARLPFNFDVLVPDLTDAASVLSSGVSSSPDDRGLSLPVLGIFERMVDEMDLRESFVSDLLKEGYDFRAGSLEGSSPPFLSFDGWLPIVARCALF